MTFGTDAAPTEGSLLQDRDGTTRWLGGTSGATFLDHLKKFMFTLKSSLGYNETPTETSPGSWFLASRGQYQTSDSRLLYMPTPDNANILAQPNENQARYLLSKVNKYMQDSMGQWSCGGIYYFGDFSLENWHAVKRDTNRHRELAFYQAAFALGTIYSLTTANSRQEGQLGEMFIASARSILGDLLEISRYSIRDVPTLALMAMYMAEVNRRDNSYHYLSNAMNICCMFGGFKGLFNDERDVRIVWTLYCLTRDASCLMGRPPVFPDEAFQLAEPSVVAGLPPPDGLCAHVKLSRIAGYIVSNTYSIAPREDMINVEDPVAQVVEPLRMLGEWREGLEPHLQIPLDLPAEPQIPFEVTPDLQMPLGSPDDPKDLYADRALCTLHMKYNQLIILTLRPLFFLAVKSYIGGDLIRVPRDIYDHAHRDYILQCRDAARRNLRLGRHISKRCNWGDDIPGKLTMPDLHHIFNAAVVLLLHHMVFIEVRTSDSDGIRFAMDVFKEEAKTECLSGGGGAIATGYASDCLGVLNDLAALVARIRPLRFKGSQHVTTGVDDIGLNIGAGNVAIGEDAAVAVGVISDEALSANLEMPNPFGTDMSGIYGPFVMAGTGPLGGHTNGKELQRWMEEENVPGLNCPFDVWHVI
ncbi:hypothetical protein VMCG_10341 [Cytospora schulzeri]|uniref:Xylanolytic transcriptional activator regulatory domain-containing protein n=1 Tax=Cytospora schulzeri TaxID=448051 RepID=A0A423VFL9_9PEZI|nr:hypothetical protein VMCG_10341 [Valsa malicola]